MHRCRAWMISSRWALMNVRQRARTAQHIQRFRRSAEMVTHGRRAWIRPCLILPRLMYENGAGVEKDYSIAAQWYRKAAAKGHAEACRNLGSIYLWGNDVDKDNMETAKWLYKAAQKGDNIAIEYLNQYLPEEYEKLKKK